MKARTDISRVIEFLYTNVDFFLAQYVSTEQFQSWAKLNNDGIKSISGDMVDAFSKGKDTFWMLVSQQRHALLALREGDSKKIHALLIKNPQIVQAIIRNLKDPIINKWYAEQATQSQQDDREERQRQRQIDRYEKASSKYKEHIENEIEKEVNNINNKILLNKLHETLIKTQFGNPATPGEDADISFTKAKVVSALLNQYENTDIKKAIDTQLVHKPKLIDALKKHTSMKQAEKILRNEDGSNQTKAQIVDSYHLHLKNNKAILTKRRDSGFNTFVKGLGVFAATILGVGVGGILAYQHLFGSKATHGNKFINKVSEIKNKYRR
jgi:hypothetical protein